MKENHLHPEGATLTALLRESRVSPGLFPRFRQNVWRRIGDAEAPAKPAAWLDALAASILRPRFAIAATAALMLAGVFAGTMEGRQDARRDSQMNYLASVAPHSLH